MKKIIMLALVVILCGCDKQIVDSSLLDEHKEQVDDLRDDKREFSEEIDELKLENANLILEIEDRNKDLQNLNEELQNLNEELIQMLDEKNLIEAEYSILDKDFDDLYFDNYSLQSYYYDLLFKYNFYIGGMLESRYDYSSENLFDIIELEIISNMDYDNPIVVNNCTDFVNSLDSNIRIILEEGTYNLSDLTEQYIENYERHLINGEGLNIDGLENVIIEGEEGKVVEIVVEDPYDAVIDLNNCKNIILRNLTLGHVIEEGAACSGSVVSSFGSYNVCIDKSELFGCGYNGVHFFASYGLVIRDTHIYDCSNYGIHFSKSSGLNIFDSLIEDCDSGWYGQAQY